MKNLMTGIVAAAMIMFSAVTFAEGKVAILNINLAIQKTEIAQQRISELRATAEYAELRAKLDSIEADLKKMGENAEKNGMTWDKEKQIEFSKKRDYSLADRKLVIEKLQAEDRVLGQKIMQELGPKAETALEELMKLEGIGLVLNAQAAIRVDNSFDITAKLTDRINKSTK